MPRTPKSASAAISLKKKSVSSTISPQKKSQLKITTKLVFLYPLQSRVKLVVSPISDRITCVSYGGHEEILGCISWFLRMVGCLMEVKLPIMHVGRCYFTCLFFYA